MGKPSPTALRKARACLRREIRTTKEDFIRVMAPIFGVETFYPVDVELTLATGDGYITPHRNLFGQHDKVVVSKWEAYDALELCYGCFLDFVRSRGYILAHELTHVGHEWVNPKLWEEETLAHASAENRSTQFTADGSYLIEMAGELGAIAYFYLRRDNFGGILSFASAHNDLTKPNYFWPAFMFFRDHVSELEEGLSSLAKMDVKTAKPILDRYRNSLYNSSMTKDEYFGIYAREIAA